MADFLKAAQEYLQQVRIEHLATSRYIVYERSNGVRFILSGVVIGAYRQLDTMQEEAALEVERRDFIIPVDELLGSPPVAGEWIEESSEPGDTIYKFMVSAEYGRNVWEWHDRERLAYRVHTVFHGEL